MTAVADLGYRIEAGDMSDLPDVMIAMGHAFDPEYGEAWTEAQCAGVLGLPGCWLLLAKSGDRAAGFAMLRSAAGEAELLLIAVCPRDRRQGLARALLTQAAQDAEKAGIDMLHLEVRDGNPALDLYRATGFVQVGRRPAYYRGRTGKVFDALTFKRQLGAD